MAIIQVGGAGGAPSNNVIRCLRESDQGDQIVGHSSNLEDLCLADADQRYLLPAARSESYPQALLRLLAHTRPNLLHVQHDFEVQAVSRLRAEITALDVALFLPASETIDICVDKHRSYVCWRDSGLTVPQTMVLSSPRDVHHAFAELGPALWLRETQGAAGAGSLRTESKQLAVAWIDSHRGWGHFTAAECLTAHSVTWSSLWCDGDLVVAQTRRRRGWAFADRSPSGVTGITRVGETCSDADVDRVALAAISAIDRHPHGIFGVDLTYDADGEPNPTEINIGRFFTTIHFFARAGLNMPLIYRNLALGEPCPPIEKQLNPLPDGLLWIRGMDVEPILTTPASLARDVSTVFA